MATKTKAKKVAIRPLADRVLIQRVEAEEKTAGGILLPESAKEKPKEGIVIALGVTWVLDGLSTCPRASRRSPTRARIVVASAIRWRLICSASCGRRSRAALLCA